MSDSFLLRLFDRATNSWVQRWSLVSIAPLRMRATHSDPFVQRNRDIFVMAMLGASVSAVVAFQFAQPSGEAFWQRAIAAVALYRCIDLFITLVRTGIFLNFRGDIDLKSQPNWRVQRILLGVLFNYVEVIMWFTVVYRQLSITSSCLFAEPIQRLDQAFNLSFSTMATIGYGKYGPNAMVSSVLAFVQVSIGIILLVLVVGSVLALLTTNSQTTAEKPAMQQAYLLSPIIAFAIIWSCLFWFFGQNLCD